MSHLCVRRSWLGVLVDDLEDAPDLRGGEEVGVLLRVEVGEGQDVEGEVCGRCGGE